MSAPNKLVVVRSTPQEQVEAILPSRETLLQDREETEERLARKERVVVPSVAEAEAVSCIVSIVAVAESDYYSAVEVIRKCMAQADENAGMARDGKPLLDGAMILAMVEEHREEIHARIREVRRRLDMSHHSLETLRELHRLAVIAKVAANLHLCSMFSLQATLGVTYDVEGESEEESEEVASQEEEEEVQPTQEKSVMLFRYDWEEFQCLGKYVDYTSAYNAALRHHANGVWEHWLWERRWSEERRQREADHPDPYNTPKRMAEKLFLIQKWKPTLEAAFDETFKSVGEANDFLARSEWMCPKSDGEPPSAGYEILTDYPHEVKTLVVEEARAGLWSESYLEDQDECAYADWPGKYCGCTHGWKRESVEKERRHKEEEEERRRYEEILDKRARGEVMEVEVVDHVALNIARAQKEQEAMEERYAETLGRIARGEVVVAANPQKAAELEEAFQKEIHWREYRRAEKVKEALKEKTNKNVAEIRRELRGEIRYRVQRRVWEGFKREAEEEDGGGGGWGREVSRS